MSLAELKVLSDWVKKAADDIFKNIEAGKTVSISTNSSETQMLVYKKGDNYKVMQAMPMQGRGATIELFSTQELVEYIYSQVALKTKPGIGYYDINPETDIF